MFADRRVAALATRRELLQARIAVRRMECVMTGLEVARPVASVERIEAHWRRLWPLLKVAGLPAALIVVSKLVQSPDGSAPKGKLAAVLATTLPLVLDMWKRLHEDGRQSVT